MPCCAFVQLSERSLQPGSSRRCPGRSCGPDFCVRNHNRLCVRRASRLVICFAVCLSYSSMCACVRGSDRIRTACVYCMKPLVISGGQTHFFDFSISLDVTFSLHTDLDIALPNLTCPPERKNANFTMSWRRTCDSHAAGHPLRPARLQSPSLHHCCS